MADENQIVAQLDVFVVGHRMERPVIIDDVDDLRGCDPQQGLKFGRRHRRLRNGAIFAVDLDGHGFVIVLVRAAFAARFLLFEHTAHGHYLSRLALWPRRSVAASGADS